MLDLGQSAPLDLFDHSAVKPVTATSPLWPILLVWSIVVFVLDVATRRVAWDRLLTREVTETFRAHAVEAARAVEAGDGGDDDVEPVELGECG